MSRGIVSGVSASMRSPSRCQPSMAGSPRRPPQPAWALSFPRRVRISLRVSGLHVVQRANERMVSYTLLVGRGVLLVGTVPTGPTRFPRGNQQTLAGVGGGAARKGGRGSPATVGSGRQMNAAIMRVGDAFDEPNRLGASRPW